jgi:hypothetical protein
MRCPSLATIRGRSKVVPSETLSRVSAKVERPATKGKNCFGVLSRDSGQSRTPAPPHNITGVMRLRHPFDGGLIPRAGMSSRIGIIFPHASLELLRNHTAVRVHRFAADESNPKIPAGGTAP